MHMHSCCSVIKIQNGFKNPAKQIMHSVWYSDGMGVVLTNVFNGN